MPELLWKTQEPGGSFEQESQGKDTVVFNVDVDGIERKAGEI